MLSVNIPVYNIEVVDLVSDLHEQASRLKIDFEIRVYDDGSDEIYKSLNSIVKKQANVVYKEMENNLGRAAIRNKMGAESKYAWLLFIDADSKINSADYLKRYLERLKPGSIICGGRCYTTQKPQNQEKLFHWKYGSIRESISASKRNKSNGFFFMSNNFILEKSTFERIHFRSEIKKYGHEDTLFGYDLMRSGYTITHIESPLEHTGLENATVFLRKSKVALDNLKVIEEDILQEERKYFRRTVHFLNRYYQLTAIFPNRFLLWLFNRYRHKLQSNILSTNPHLLYFDLYKLGYYASIKNR